jgi:RNA polymerase sigma factor (sigma-70 family)
MDDVPVFEKEKDARAWLVARAIDRAVAPFLGFLSTNSTLRLRDYLADAAQTHPVVRLLASRATRELAPKQEEEQPLREAAKKRGKEGDEKPPATAKAKRVKREPAIENLPPLTRGDYDSYALKVIVPVAKEVATRAGRGKDKDFVDGLIREGWLVAVQVEKNWDRTKGAFSTFLWGCVQNRLINEAKLSRNVRERPVSNVWVNDLTEDDAGDRDPIEAFENTLDMMAGSWFLGFFSEKELPPDEQAERAEQFEDLRRAMEELEPRERQLLGLVFSEETPVLQAARQMGIPESTARLHLEQAIGDLRKILTKKTNIVPFRPR